jgi:hypothetical protein
MSSVHGLSPKLYLEERAMSLTDQRRIGSTCRMRNSIATTTTTTTTTPVVRSVVRR